jgi:EmrB/QacA subfamily drug resistance transporter
MIILTSNHSFFNIVKYLIYEQRQEKKMTDNQSIRSILAPLTAIIVGLFMVILDGTAMNVMIPKLVEEFGQGLTTVQWTVTGYMLAQAAVIPLAGWLSDRFGAKKIFLLSVAMFTVGSLLCALSNSIEQLIFYRVLQGLGGGMVMPIAMAFTYRLSPPGKVGAVMGMMGIPILLAPAFGPVLSGWMVDFATWHWIFLINLPIGLVGVIIGAKTLPSISKQSVAELDILGIIFGPIAFAALVYGISQGGTSWTSWKTFTGLGIGILSLLIFIIVELRRQNPLLELRVFKSKQFTQAVIVQWIAQIALFGTLFLFPLFLQSAKGYTAFDTGLMLLPQALSAGLMMPFSGKLFDRFGARYLVLGGMLIVTAAGLLISNVDVNTSTATMIIPLIMLGLGMGTFMMPLNTHIIQAAPQNLVGRVTSLTNAAQQVVSSFAVAGLTTILSKQMETAIKAGKTMDLAWSDSFSTTFLVQVGIAIIGAGLALLLRKPKSSIAEDASQEEAQSATYMAH